MLGRSCVLIGIKRTALQKENKTNKNTEDKKGGVHRQGSRIICQKWCFSMQKCDGWTALVKFVNQVFQRWKWVPK